MNPLKLVGGVLKTAASLILPGLSPADSGVLNQAAEIVSRIKDTPEVRLAMLEHEQELKRLAIEEMRVANEESLAMIASDDKFVSRARPSGLYTFYVCAVAEIVAELLGADIDPVAILTILAPLAGVGGTYVLNRTREKLSG